MESGRRPASDRETLRVETGVLEITGKSSNNINVFIANINGD